MAGLYLHIPFCKSRCVYCGFYSTTLHPLRSRYVDALCREMELRAASGNSLTPYANISTIYLGGGTPSQLNERELKKIFDSIYNIYKVEKDAEITIECNPDDISAEYAALLSRLPVNRVSMGAQTFSDERLRFLHRRHTAIQVDQAVGMLREAGFKNISIDLMFGFPGETIDDWRRDIDHALLLDVEHISAYSLTYEEGTPLYALKDQGISEDLSLAMYHLLIDRLTSAGYEHYEISNFAKMLPSVSDTLPPMPHSFRSRHNSSYWQGTPYIGIGAAAHSYDIDTRHWNVSDVRKYIQLIESGKLPTDETEILSVSEKYDDMVTTALRTREGINLEAVSRMFGPDYYNFILKNAQPHLSSHLLAMTDDQHLKLTRDGLFVSDSIMSDLMYV